MSTEPEVIEEISFLTRSPIRIHILSVLSERGELSRDQLRDQFDCDRTTLSRNLNALREHGWIRTTANNQTYTTATCGDLVADEFPRFAEKVETGINLRGFMKWVPDDAFDLDLRHLNDAEVVLADPNDPYAAVNQHVEAVKTTSSFNALLPVVGQHGLEVAVQRMKEVEARHEFVVEADCAEILQSEPNYAELLEEGLDTGRLTVYVTGENIPYFVGIYDDIVQVGVEDDEGMPRALLTTANDTAREWAEGKYEEYRQHAEPLHLIH